MAIIDLPLFSSYHLQPISSAPLLRDIHINCPSTKAGIIHLIPVNSASAATFLIGADC
jgi:hypothetical protein